MIHTQPHPLAGETVTLAEGVTDPVRSEVVGGTEYRVEDWWDRVTGSSWKDTEGNPAVVHYAVRMMLSVDPIPLDDEVVYGKIGPYGLLVHTTDLGGGAG